MIVFLIIYFQLPLDLQERVKSHLTREQVITLEDASTHAPETKMIRVPMPTFPPTAMVYSVNKVAPVHATAISTPVDNKSNKVDTVPMTLIAKVLTQPEAQHKPQRIYICVKCKNDITFMDKEIQTSITYGTNEVNGVHGTGTFRTHHGTMYPMVHRPRLNSTETEI